MDHLSSITSIPEPTLRLLTSVLAAYPVALIQRQLLSPSISSFTRNLFNVISGISIAFFFCQRDIIHSWITVTVTWSICQLSQLYLHPKLWWIAQSISFLFNFGYLLIAYWFTASQEYDINWTTPQSVLTLRLIGFAFDFADGAKCYLNSSSSKSATCISSSKPTTTAATTRAPTPVDSGTDMPNPNHHKSTPTPTSNTISPPPPLPQRVITETNRVPTAWSDDLSLPYLPTYLEMLGFAYFSGSFLVGPQFSFSLYRKYLSLNLFTSHVPINTSSPVPINFSLPQIFSSGASYARRTFMIALCYLLLTQVLSMYFWSGATQLPNFLNASFLYRVAFGWACGKTALTKYVGMWLLTEGACALSGIAFDGIDSTGQMRWGGLANINVRKFELATSLNQVIASFNINTNHWARLYLFKRLRFLGNKHLSSIGTLTFLAIWHGFHPGYAFAFSHEFVDMIVERRLKATTSGLAYSLSKHPFGRILVNFTCWLLTTSALYYSALGFDLLTAKSILVTFNSLHWYGHWALPLLFLITIIYPGRRVTPSGHTGNKKVD